MPDSYVARRLASSRAKTQVPARRRHVVGAADDVAEADADRIAGQALVNLAGQQPMALRTGPTRIARSSRHSSSPAAPAADSSVRTIGAAGGEVDEPTQRALDSARGAGKALEMPVRQSMETAFGADFGRVRVHDGASADRISQTMQAQAFTVGSDVFFSAGSYRPRTAAGQQLLAHELGHVVQNDSGVPGSNVNRLFDRKKKKAKPVRAGAGSGPSTPASTDYSDEESFEDAASVKSSADADVATESGEAEYDEATAAKDSDEGAAPTEEMLRAAAKKVNRANYGQTKSLNQMSRLLRDTMSHDDLKHARSRKTTLYKLMVALDELTGTTHASSQLPLVKRVGRLAERYLHGHRKSTDQDVRARVRLVEDVDQLAQVHILRAYADMKYALDVQGKGQHSFLHHTETEQVLLKTANYAAKTVGNEKPTKYDEGARALTMQHGLSQGELIAIRTYTAENYKYMNPAMTNFDSGLEKYNREVTGAGDGTTMAPAAKKQLKLEGTAHVGMAVKGLAKLPPWTEGSTYRGDNVDLARMQKLYTLGKIAANEMLLSTSKGPGTARKFLRTSGNGPIKLMVEVDMTGGTGGRDVTRISTNTNEQEVILMPGAKYKTVSIEEYDVVTEERTPLTRRPDGRPGADGKVPAYYVVVKQIG